MLSNHPVRFNDSMSNLFWFTCDTSWKLQKNSKSRAITLKLLNKSRQKYPGAQLHMLINIPVKFHDSRSNTFWVTCDTIWKLQNFTKSRTITLKILNESRRKYPGAQLHMLINIPVKFHDSRSNTYWVTCDTSWKLQNFTKRRAKTLKTLKISRRSYLGAQLHMLINIPGKFHDSRSYTFWVTCYTS
jgi:choline kinase